MSDKQVALLVAALWIWITRKQIDITGGGDIVLSTKKLLKVAAQFTIWLDQFDYTTDK